MPLTKVSYSMIDGAPINVLDYGADPTGVADSYAAFVAALAAGNYVYVPSGTYKLTQTLSITGDKVLTGPESSQFAVAFAIINFTGTGNCFQAISAEFGAVSIRNLEIRGGDGSGAYAIYSTRPQSIFENLLIESWNNSGIALEEAGTGSQASWSTMVRQVKYVAPATATPYRGYQVNINGGHVTLDGCVAIRGSIGINIDQGEAINIWRCSTNLQCNTATFPFSSLSRDNQCGIRLSGDGYKTAVSIRECYIEGFTYGIYLEACESLSIEDNYIADLGVSSDFVGVPGSLIYLKDSNITSTDYIKNVTIRNNRLAGSGNGISTVYIGEDAEHIEIYNNDIASVGSAGYLGAVPTAIFKEDGFLTYVGDNRYRLNPFIGVQFNDAFGLLTEMFWDRGTFTAVVNGSGTNGTYQIASQVSTYTVFGRSVTLNSKITLASSVTGGGSGNLQISGLPYTGKTATFAYGSVVLSGVNYTTAGASIASEMDGTSHSSAIWFAETADNASSAYVPISGVAANNVIAFSITYEF
jgi:hypothetical protein